MNRSKLSFVFYLLAMFVAGVAAGAFGHRLYMVSTVSATRRPSPEEFRRAYVQDLKTRLNLKESQVQDLQSILDDTRKQYQAFRERHKDEWEQIHASQVGRIRAILSEDQRAGYERFREEREKRMREERGKH